MFIKSNISFSTGVTVGSLGIDSCQSAIRAGSLVSNVHSYKTPLATKTSQINPSNIAVYIGALDSETTMAVADVLSVLNIPQISYGASTILLKDMEKYPYFLRTVPADDKQVSPISHLSFHKKDSLTKQNIVNTNIEH